MSERSKKNRAMTTMSCLHSGTVLGRRLWGSTEPSRLGWTLATDRMQRRSGHAMVSMSSSKSLTPPPRNTLYLSVQFTLWRTENLRCMLLLMQIDNAPYKKNLVFALIFTFQSNLEAAACKSSVIYPPFCTVYWNACNLCS